MEILHSGKTLGYGYRRISYKGNRLYRFIKDDYSGEYRSYFAVGKSVTVLDISQKSRNTVYWELIKMTNYNYFGSIDIVIPPLTFFKKNDMNNIDFNFYHVFTFYDPEFSYTGQDNNDNCPVKKYLQEMEINNIAFFESQHGLNGSYEGRQVAFISHANEAFLNSVLMMFRMRFG